MNQIDLKNDQPPQEPQAEQNMGQIKEMGSSQVQNANGNIHCLTIVGQIEGHMLLPPQNKTTKYEHVIPQLVSLEEDERIDGLVIVLNTVGGDVEAGLAISEMVASMKKPTVSLVLGGGHSIGVPLAVCAKRSFIVPSAAMTIHPIRMNGLVIGVPQTYEYLNKMQERVVQFITHNSNIKRDVLLELMLKTGEIANDVGSIILGQDAVKVGLIDEVGGIKEALDYLYVMIKQNKPPAEEKQSLQPDSKQ